MADSGIVVNDGDLIADQRSAADMGSSVSAVELMAEQQAPGLSGVHHQHQHQHQYPALSLSHMVPRQYPFMHHPQQPTLEQVAAASYQQAIGGYLPTAIPTPTAACFCQCVYNPSGYPQSCAIHRTMSLPTQQFLMPQPTAMYADAAGPSYLHPAPPNMPTMLNAMRIPPPQAAARGVSANNRNQHKRQLHESISVTSSSDDDDINVAGGRDESLVAGSSKGPRKSLRVHSPPKTTELSFGGGRSTDTIDLAASSDDDEVIEPGDPAPSAVMPSSSISPVLAAQMHVPPRNHSSASAIDHRPPPSATVQSLQPDQQCRYAHCNCHSHACGCVQCPVAAHCHHFHHHHHAPQLSCQLHSPCGCGTPTNAPLDYPPVNRPPPLRDSMRVSQVRQPPHQSHQGHDIHPNQQRLRQSQNHQMELNRQAQARFFQSRQRHAAAVAAQQQRNVAAAAAAAAYLPPPTATTFADWAALTASAALAAAANQPRRYPTATQSPFLMVAPNPHQPPHARNIIMAPNVPMLSTLAAHPMPIEFGMLVHAGPILLQSAEGLVFNPPTVTEPQPIGASIDQIERCTVISLYSRDAEVPEGEGERCTVCLADFDTGERVRSLQCAHLFHTECIDRWLVYNKKCPVCRVDMDKNSPRRSTFRVSTASN